MVAVCCCLKADLYRARPLSTSSETVVRWHELAMKNDFSSFVELRGVFPSVDLVEEKLVFNLGAYRLICGVSFLRKTFYFKTLLNHADYNEGGWKS